MADGGEAAALAAARDEVDDYLALGRSQVSEIIFKKYYYYYYYYVDNIKSRVGRGGAFCRFLSVRVKLALPAPPPQLAAGGNVAGAGYAQFRFPPPFLRFRRRRRRRSWRRATWRGPAMSN